MIDWLVNKDIQLFLFLNGNRSAILDIIMPIISHKLTFIPLYIFIIWFLFKHRSNQFWFLLLGLILSIVLSDQGSVILFKNVFHRLRPCHNPELSGLVYIVNGKCGGTYGFISSHASNAFAFTTFLILLFYKEIKWIWSLVLWAIVVAFSRVYLGVHYPADIFVGALFGILCGYLAFVIQEKVYFKIQLRRSSND